VAIFIKAEPSQSTLGDMCADDSLLSPGDFEFATWAVGTLLCVGVENAPIVGALWDSFGPAQKVKEAIASVKPKSEAVGYISNVTALALFLQTSAIDSKRVTAPTQARAEVSDQSSAAMRSSVAFFGSCSVVISAT